MAKIEIEKNLSLTRRRVKGINKESTGHRTFCPDLFYRKSIRTIIRQISTLCLKPAGLGTTLGDKRMWRGLRERHVQG